MQSRTFARLAWGALGYNLLVILFGALVRATGSGAGCGSHWPLCNGVVLPRNASTETLIELTHRVGSGFCLILAIVLVAAARRAFLPGHPSRKGAWAVLALTVVEALVGAGLVLLELVADNDSVARAVVLGVHLFNTFLLVAALALTAWWGLTPGRLDARTPGRLGIWRNEAARGLLLVLLGLLVVGISGAVTALGDTLFPAGTLAEGLRQDVSPTAHFLVQLRVLHPLLAVSVGLVLVALSLRLLNRKVSPRTATVARATGILVLMQLALGVVNMVLLAPTALQLLHLLMADLVWVAAVLLTASVAAESVAESAAVRSDLDPAALLPR
jgi:heme A synthase